jgi:hypothetical protein
VKYHGYQTPLEKVLGSKRVPPEAYYTSPQGEWSGWADAWFCVGGGPQAERRAAIRAMVSCPTGSIRMATGDRLVKDVIAHDFPAPIHEAELPGVYHLGSVSWECAA